MWLTLLTSCAVDPAPEDLDGLVHWLWAHYGDEEDPGFEDALANLHTSVAPLEEPLTGDLTSLTEEEHGGLTGQDPSATRGLLLANPFPCTLETLEPILYALDQSTQYPDVYTTYDRTYTSDLDDFTARETSHLSWEVTLTSELLNVAFTEQVVGGLRHIPETEGGPALLTRTYIPVPAEFEAEGWTWNQDYQIEAWLEPEPGTIWHVYGLWREMDLGGLSMANDGVANTTLDGMSDWDGRTEELCAGAR